MFPYCFGKKPYFALPPIITFRKPQLTFFPVAPPPELKKQEAIFRHKYSGLKGYLDADLLISLIFQVFYLLQYVEACLLSRRYFQLAPSLRHFSETAYSRNNRLLLKRSPPGFHAIHASALLIPLRSLPLPGSHSHYWRTLKYRVSVVVSFPG